MLAPLLFYFLLQLYFKWKTLHIPVMLFDSYYFFLDLCEYILLPVGIFLYINITVNNSSFISTGIESGGGRGPMGGDRDAYRRGPRMYIMKHRFTKKNINLVCLNDRRVHSYVVIFKSNNNVCLT